MGGGPPCFPQGFTCPAVLWILPAVIRFRLRGFHLLRPAFPKPFGYLLTIHYAVHNPRYKYLVWALPISLAATLEIDVSFSSSPYLDVSVQAVPSMQLWIHCTVAGVRPAGFPHSEICGSMDICSSPQLFAACHVFRRLSVPRHSPCALCCLTSFRFTLLV